MENETQTGALDGAPRVEPTISFARRCGLWLAAWAVALIITAPNLKAAPLIWVFPFGLFRFVGFPSQSYAELLAVGWSPYLVLTAVSLLIPRRRAYYIAYGILCLLLLSNAAGCRLMFHELKEAADR